MGGSVSSAEKNYFHIIAILVTIYSCIFRKFLLNPKSDRCSTSPSEVALTPAQGK